MRLLICWEIDFAGKFVTVERDYRDYFFRLNLNSFQPLYPFLLPYFSRSSNFPLECWEGEEPLTGTSNCYQSVIRFSLLLPLYFFSLSLYTGLCSALLTNKTLRRRVEFAPQKLWCIGFFTVRAAPPTAFSFCCPENHLLCVCYIHSLSLSALSSLPFRVSFAI